MLEFMASPPADSSSSLILISEATSVVCDDVKMIETHSTEKEEDSEKEEILSRLQVIGNGITKMVPVIDITEEKVDEVSREPTNENPEEHGSEKEREGNMTTLLQGLDVKSNLRQTHMDRSSKENEPAELDFDITNFNPLKEADQIQVHYLIFNFSYWLHSLGGLDFFFFFFGGMCIRV